MNATRTCPSHTKPATIQSARALLCALCPVSAAQHHLEDGAWEADLLTKIERRQTEANDGSSLLTVVVDEILEMVRLLTLLCLRVVILDQNECEQICQPDRFDYVTTDQTCNVRRKDEKSCMVRKRLHHPVPLP